MQELTIIGLGRKSIVPLLYFTRRTLNPQLRRAQVLILETHDDTTPGYIPPEWATVTVDPSVEFDPMVFDICDGRRLLIIGDLSQPIATLLPEVIDSADDCFVSVDVFGIIPLAEEDPENNAHAVQRYSFLRARFPGIVYALPPEPERDPTYEKNLVWIERVLDYPLWGILDEAALSESEYPLTTEMLDPASKAPEAMLEVLESVPSVLPNEDACGQLSIRSAATGKVYLNGIVIGPDEPGGKGFIEVQTTIPTPENIPVDEYIKQYIAEFREFHNHRRFSLGIDHGRLKRSLYLNIDTAELAARFLTEMLAFDHPDFNPDEIEVDMSPIDCGPDLYLVIPDVHGRTFWKEAVEKHPELPVVFLGDYHDPYPDEHISPRESLHNFMEILSFARNNPRCTLLLGNHDLHYIYSFGGGCRYDYARARQLGELFRANRDLFKLIHVWKPCFAHPIVFSHAPILAEWAETVGLPDDARTIADLLNPIADGDQADAARDLLDRCTALRGGYDAAGSPVWADVRELNADVHTLEDYNVFAHTRSRFETIEANWACLDCRKAFIIDRNAKITPA